MDRLVIMEDEMALNAHVMTVQELDAMTPAERHQHFIDSIVDPATLTQAQREAVYAEQERVLAEIQGR
jgi:hypothetical protein